MDLAGYEHHGKRRNPSHNIPKWVEHPSSWGNSEHKLQHGSPGGCQKNCENCWRPVGNHPSRKVQLNRMEPKGDVMKLGSFLGRLCEAASMTLIFLFRLRVMVSRLIQKHLTPVQVPFYRHRYKDVSSPYHLQIPRPEKNKLNPCAGSFLYIAPLISTPPHPPKKGKEKKNNKNGYPPTN